MKKLLTILVLCAVCVCCAVGFTACNENATDGKDAQILSIYNTYVAYAEENGETPLSYEEWIKSIKGENGKDGKDGINGIDGKNGKDGVSIVKIEKTSTDGLIDTYTITYSNGETTTFTVKNGKNGENGGKGADGTTPQLRVNSDTNEWEVSYDKGATWTGLGVNAAGDNGIGIKSATINEDGDLIIILTDDKVINAGKVIAPAYKIDENNKITFKSFTVEDKKVSGKVSNEMETFYFNDEIEITGHAGYKVFRDFDCQQEVVSKTVNLSVGDNYFYILEYCGEYSNFYTVNVRRKPIYTVKFDSNGGSECLDQQVEEDACAVDPKPVLNGYGYTWDYDLSMPITENKTIMASWQAIFSVYANRIRGLTDYGKTLTEIVIPESIGGTAITELGGYSDRLFEGANIELTKIIIPNSITKLVATTFVTHDNFNFPLIRFNNLQYNEYENGLYLGNDDNPYLVFIKPKSTDLTSLTINEDTKIVSWIGLYNYQNLTEINVSDNISDIHFTFDDSHLTTVNYDGTMAQWITVSNTSLWQENYSSKYMIVKCQDGDLGYKN